MFKGSFKCVRWIIGTLTKLFFGEDEFEEFIELFKLIFAINVIQARGILYADCCFFEQLPILLVLKIGN